MRGYTSESMLRWHEPFAPDEVERIAGLARTGVYIELENFAAYGEGLTRGKMRSLALMSEGRPAQKLLGDPDERQYKLRVTPYRSSRWTGEWVRCHYHGYLDDDLIAGGSLDIGNCKQVSQSGFQAPLLKHWKVRWAWHGQSQKSQ